MAKFQKTDGAEPMSVCDQKRNLCEVEPAKLEQIEGGCFGPGPQPIGWPPNMPPIIWWLK
jgi:hypothetical protein